MVTIKINKVTLCYCHAVNDVFFQSRHRLFDFGHTYKCPKSNSQITCTLFYAFFRKDKR